MEQEQSNQLTSKEAYQLKKEKEQEEKKRLSQKRAIKKTLKILVPVMLLGSGLGLFLWYQSTRPAAPESNIISRRGIHWHPELTIIIKGQKQEILANLGIGVRHESIHTHDTSGVLHLEMQGVAREKDIKLGRFFEIWDKQFNSDCIFDSCNGQDGTVKMFVNSQENTEFENYQMKDSDKIEIRYE